MPVRPPPPPLAQGRIERIRGEDGGTLVRPGLPHCQQRMALRTLVSGPTATFTRILTGLEKSTGLPAEG